MNPATLIAKKKNTKNILNYIIKCEEVSRPVLASTFRVSTATVTNIINELIHNDIVYEGRCDSTGLGRKAKLIRFNSKLYYVIAANIIDGSTLKLSICDLLGNIVQTTTKTIDFRHTATNTETDIVENTAKAFSAFIGSVPFEIKHKLLAVALSIPGVVNYNQTIYAPFLNWKSLPLLKPLQAAVKLPVFMENITRIKSVYEMRYTDECDKNVIYLSLSPTLGMVQYFNNKMVMGKSGLSGEIGHVSVEINGEKCYCGNSGCFELHCGEVSLISKAESMLDGHSRDDILFELVQNQNKPISIETMIEARSAGSIKMHSLFSNTAKYLGAGLANIVNCFDPDKIIISGTLLDHDDFAYNTAIEEAKSRIVNKFTREIPINKGRLNSDEMEKALCAFALSRTYNVILK